MLRAWAAFVAFVALGAFCPLARPGAAASDWPRFRGPAADGISREQGINKDWARRPPRTLWSVALGDQGYAGPSVARGLVYIVDHQGSRDIVRALRLADGKEAWRFPYEDTDRMVYGFARATPTVDAGRVYTMSRLGVLHCLDAATGRLVWKRDTVAEFKGRRPMWDIAASPLIDGGLVIVTPGGPNAAIAALDKRTGATVWQGGGDAVPGYCTPVISTISGQRQYLTMAAKAAAGYSTRNGAVLWSYPWEARDGTNVACPVAVGDAVFVSSAYGMGCALLDVRGSQVSPRWQSQELSAHINTPVLLGGYLYGTTDPSGNLVCLDTATGRARWKQPGFEKGGAVAVDGVLLALCGGTGDLVMVRPGPERYEELGRVRPLGGQSWSPPVVADGKLLVRNNSTLACLDLR